MVHACCFHTGSASFCVACRNDSTIFSPCQPFLRKKLLRTCGRCERPHALCAVWAWSSLAYVLLRTCGRHERPPALCAVWARSPLAYVKGSLPFDRSLWHGPSLRRTQAARALRAPERRKKRVSPHPAAVPAGPCSSAPSDKGPAARERCERPCGARNASPRTLWRPMPGHAPPHRPAEAPLHAPAPAAVGASPRPPLAPWVRASPAPAARERFECPKARREASALWAVGPKAQSDPKRGSETMSATGREARMIEQPGCKKRASPHPRGCPRRAMLLVPVGRSPAACARSRRGRRVPAPTARAMGAGLPRPRCARAFRVSKGAKGSVCPVGTWAEGPKRPEAGQRNHERDRQGSAND